MLTIKLSKRYLWSECNRLARITDFDALEIVELVNDLSALYGRIVVESTLAKAISLRYTPSVSDIGGFTREFRLHYKEYKRSNLGKDFKLP